MNRALRARAIRLLPLLAGLALGLHGCAPRVVPPPALDVETLRARFARARAQREARIGRAEAPVMLWATLPGRGKLPAVDGTVRFGGVDSVKLVVSGFFGTALEANALSDSVTVWVPSRRAVLRADAQRDSIGMTRPGEWLGAALGALWQPPEDAWQAGGREDSTLAITWSPDDRMARRMNVGTSGLPTRFQMDLGEGRHAVARYLVWRSVEGVPWPMVVELADGAQTWRVLVKVERVRFLPTTQRGRLDVRVPEGTEQWTWQRLRDVLVGRRARG